MKEASRGLKGASSGLRRGLKVASRGLHLRKASRGLEGGFKGASNSEGEGGLRRGLKGLEEASKGLEGGLKGAAFSAEAGFEDACKGALYQRFRHV